MTLDELIEELIQAREDLGGDGSGDVAFDDDDSSNDDGLEITGTFVDADTNTVFLLSEEEGETDG